MPTTLKIESLLAHVVAITSHRDHKMLDLSVISALHHVTAAPQARMLEVFEFESAFFVRPQAFIRDGQAIIPDGSEQVSQPISEYPALEHCMKGRLARIAEMLDEGSQRVWIPLWQNEKLVNALEVTHHQAASARTLHIADGILDVYRNQQNLLDYSERDSLTGLLNRKTFDENFSRMLASSTSCARPPADAPERRQHGDEQSQWLAVIDIDHFKRVNDVFGHLYGDEVLILLANKLRESFRTDDRVFRFGGEEFVVLLRSATLAEALQIFERFRTVVEAHDFPQVGKVTVSIGFTAISYETPVVLLGRADQALYYAKENGRNRVCNYQQLADDNLLRPETPPESVAEFF